ncbi:hypothetical protein [Cellulomonas endophytica]|uniref:hypothetical protein n=1 Tax=Cellulomonas endophytica TaxID=2494735 RepID=UPI00196B209A|nr:hypothetical protein [Cellulomonas endophytica]
MSTSSSPSPSPSPSPSAPVPSSSATGGLRGRRAVVVLALVAVLSLGAGLLLSRFVVSPGQAAARAAAPTAGAITVPVESRTIASTVVLRGDVGYDDPVGVRLEQGDLGGPAVVTGQVPAVGASLDAASVVLEVVGRPVVLLPGDLPTYRTLRAGVSGPDVLQLRASLGALGIGAGDPAEDTYDAALAEGVRALYARVGYEPPPVDAEVASGVEAAQEGLRAAQEAETDARAALATAQRGTVTAAERVRLDGDVVVARTGVDFARQQCALAVEERDPTVDCTAPALAVLAAALDTAVAARAAVDVAPDTRPESAAVTAAATAVTRARDELRTAQARSLTPLPAAEVVFVPTLPRRVDAVAVQRGQTATGDVLTLSGATIQLRAQASVEEADLMPAGTTGTVAVDGTDVPVTVAEITAAAAPEPAEGGDGAEGEGDPGTGAVDTGERTVVLTFGELTPEQASALQGQNVRVTIPVSSTEGEVLAVPLAALTAGPGGESRVELAGEDGTGRLVEVETGLAADGYVELASSAEPLAAGDLVVVGVQAGDDRAGPGEDRDADDEGTTADAG